MLSIQLNSRMFHLRVGANKWWKKFILWLSSFYEYLACPFLNVLAPLRNKLLFVFASLLLSMHGKLGPFDIGVELMLLGLDKC